MSHVFPFTAAHFHLVLVVASISHFVTAATKFSCCPSNKKKSALFFIFRSKSLSPFFSLSFVGLLLIFAISLSFSCSMFQICGHDNLSKLNTLDNTDTETIILLTLFLSLLYKTPVAMRFPARKTSSCIWVTIQVDWVILHWYACGADGRSLGRAGGRCTVTWSPNFHGWVDYFVFLPTVLRWIVSGATAPL